MENYYRNKSRAIAIIDIIWSSVGLGSTILTFFGLALITQSDRNEFNNNKRTSTFNTELTNTLESTGPNDEIYFRPNNNRRPQDINMMANVMLGVVMLAMAINTIQLIAAIRLLKACDIEMDSNKSIKCCRFWCCITIFFVVLLGLHLFTPGRISVPGQIFSMAQILFRALGLYYVSEFIKELAHGPIIPMNLGPGMGNPTAAANSLFRLPNHHPLSMFNHPARNMYPKPPPGYPPGGEEPPPPYTSSEAPPPYEHVGKI